MRSIAILAGCAAIFITAAPLAVQAQTASPSTTVKGDVNAMWEKLQGSWMQTKGAIKEQWGKLTDDDLMEIQGRRDQLVGKIQTRYGIGRDEAEAQVSGWEHKYQSM